MERRQLAQVWLRITVRSNCARVFNRCLAPGVWIEDCASRGHRLGRRRRYIRNLPILWHRCAAATVQLPRWRRRVGHRSTAVHFRTRGLLRRIFAVCGLFRRRSAGDGANRKMEGAWSGRRLGGIGRCGAQRNAWRAAWTSRRRTSTVYLEASTLYRKTCHRGAFTWCREPRLLLFSSRAETPRARAMGARRFARRRSTLALARFVAHGARAIAAWLRTRDVRPGIPPLPIRGPIARVSGFLSRVAAQHLFGRISVAGFSRIGNSRWVRRSGVVRRSSSLHSEGPGYPISGIGTGGRANRQPVRMLHSNGRNLFLCHSGDASWARYAADLRLQCQATARPHARFEPERDRPVSVFHDSSDDGRCRLGASKTSFGRGTCRGLDSGFPSFRGLASGWIERRSLFLAGPGRRENFLVIHATGIPHCATRHRHIGRTAKRVVQPRPVLRFREQLPCCRTLLASFDRSLSKLV